MRSTLNRWRTDCSDYFQHCSSRKRYSITVLTLLLLTVTWFLAVYAPLRYDTAITTLMVQALQQEYGQVQDITPELQELEQRYAREKERLPKAEHQTASLADRVMQHCDTMRVQLLAFTQSDNEQQQQVTVTIKGSFENIMAFFSSLTDHHMLVQIPAFTITPLNENDMQVQCTLVYQIPEKLGIL